VTDAPEWFRRAIESKPEHLVAVVDGVDVHYRAWGSTNSPGVVLTHGGGANSSWWDHIGPFLAHDFRVIAPDLTGHGDSGWKPTYDRPQWAFEMAGCADADGMDRPMYVGHSMGGWLSVLLGVERPAVMRGIIVVDSPMMEDEPPEEEPMRRRPEVKKVYPTLADAIGRFRVVPPQPVVLPYVAEHVATESLKQVEGGWTWKFDTAVFGDRSWHRNLLPDLTVPMSLLRCENGMCTARMGQRMNEMVPGGVSVIELPEAGHHAMMDQPLALAAAIRALLAVFPTRD
jgi:pimeloyl-ACP methyl ester carboxylesterase